MPTDADRLEAIQWGQDMIRKKAAEFGAPVEWTDEQVTAHERRMAESMTYDNEFAFTIDTRICDYTFRHGVQAALGWSDEITMAEFMMLIHPDYFIMFQRWAGAAYSTSQRFKERATRLRHTYRVMFPLKNREGHYLQVIQTSIMLQADKDGNMIKYFNRYYVSHRAWNFAPLRPDIFDGRDLSDELSKEMNMEIAQGISKNLFKSAEIRILRRYHDIAIEKNGDKELPEIWRQPTLAEVAELLNTNLENVRYQRREILRKANEHLERSFEQLDDLYVELRRLGFFKDPDPEQ